MEERQPPRYRFVGVRLIRGQVELLDACVALTKQTRSDLIREALAGFLPRLYAQVKDNSNEQKVD